MGYSSFMARLGVAVSPLIIILEDTWSYLPGILFTFVALTATLSVSFLPETMNVRLPETIEDVEQTRFDTTPPSEILCEKSTSNCVNVCLFYRRRSIPSSDDKNSLN